jgi:rare lipoprotein A
MTRLFTACLSLLAFATAAQADARVTATWYGNELRGHRTASGAPFNPNGMTAAHRSLPFGTCLVVGNPRTGKSVRSPLMIAAHSRQGSRSICLMARHG